MAVEGTAVKAAQYWDDETQKMVSVNLSVRDIIFFRLLDKLAGAVSRG